MKNSYPNLRALWYDGESDLILDLFDFFRPSKLFIEDSLVERLSDVFKNLTQSDPKVLKSKSNRVLKKYQFCVVPSNDTHAHLFSKLPPEASQFFICNWKDEGAGRALNSLKIAHNRLKYTKDFFLKFDSVLLANDWGHEELYVTKKFNDNRIPVACIQESVIDFGDKCRRMEWCNYPFIEGLATTKHLDREIYFLTGNPRYESIKIEPPSKELKALINCNFTYGVQEIFRDHWITSCVETVKNLEMQYLISQHPRDPANLENYHHVKSGADKIHGMLKESRVLITRFSSLIHEALSMGRPVIYYNPHGEKMQYDFEPDQMHLITAKDPHELNQALLKIQTLDDPREDPFYLNYINRHCGSADGKASQRMIQALQLVAAHPSERKTIPIFRLAKLLLRRLQFSFPLKPLKSWRNNAKNM